MHNNKDLVTKEKNMTKKKAENLNKEAKSFTLYDKIINIMHDYKEDNLHLSARQKAMQKNVSTSSIRLVWIVFISVFLLLLWAGFSNLDVIVRGMGQVVPSQRIQLIQNLEGGILEEILVKEGEIVEENQLLARIENVSAGSQYREALIRSLDLQATIARLKALIENTDPLYPEEVLENQELVNRHNNIFKAMKEQEQAELDILISQAEAQLKEASELKAKEKELKTSLELVTKQRQLAEVAMRQGAYSELEFLGIEQNVQKIKSDLIALEHSIPRVEIKAREMQERQKSYDAERRLKHNQEIGLNESQLISLQELLKAGSDKVSRTELRTPVRGVVKRIYQTTVGGVLAPGATLMDIVPLDDNLIIEARFSPADIAFLSPNLPAIVRFSAYDFSVYGSMDASVDTISADTLQDNNGMIFYIVKIKTKDTVFKTQGRELPIIAGMQAEVDIVTGKKTILDYILKPILKVTNRAFREQ